MNRSTAPISEDAQDIVRVPVVHYVATMPYYRAYKTFAFHTDVCAQCDDGSALPCPVGGRLADAVEDALELQRTAARQN